MESLSLLLHVSGVLSVIKIDTELHANQFVGS
jgi:hypothetical protein